MQKTLPLYLGPSVIGSVVIEENNGYINFLATTYANIRGICRAYVKSSRASLLIGVLAPDGSAFSSKRHLTKSSLLGSGISFNEISYAYAICKKEADFDANTSGSASSSFSEILNKNTAALALSKSTGTKVCKTGHGIEIAVPLFNNLPFPRPDILCITTPVRIDGKFFGKVFIDPDGNFILPSRHTQHYREPESQLY